MSKVLFEKGRTMMMSDSDLEGTIEEDVWDDRKLNDAYDKALKIANAEVAKRVAMSTNTFTVNHEGHMKTKKDKQKAHDSKPGSSKTPKKEEFKPGMACRALYEEDGQEYEAFVLRIINDKECVVKFLGYENCEIVPIATLKASLGKTERQQQIKQAATEKTGEQSNMEWRECESDRVPSPGSTDPLSQRRKKTPKKKKNHKQANSFEMPDMPFPMPNLSMMANLGSLDLPMPPPPPMAMPDHADSEEQAVSSMLLSWYMSGYYTGLYQGMKRARQGRKDV